jgi:fatty acid desaturase
MYTNTPQDPHWFGTAPWLMTDPLTPRNWLHRNVMPYINWFIFWFGVLGNSVTHLIQIVSGWEPLHYGFLCKPITLALLTYNIGFYQALMTMFVQYGIVSTWFYTIAIMNHNTEDGWDIDARNNAQDWGEAQLIACADIGVGLTFYESARYLWLNYHTVHHLFPHTCMSKHPGIQTILVETCKDFNIRYECNDFTSLYLEMCENFGLARHEGKYTFNDFKLRLGDPTK